MRFSNLLIIIASVMVTSCSREPGSTQRVGVGANPTDGRVAHDVKSPDPADIEKELELLKGVWEHVETEFDGKQTKEDPGKLTRTFKGDEMIDENKEAPNLTHRGKIKIDPTRNPKTLDFYVSGTKKPAKYIYELKGDTLTFCSLLGSNDYPKRIMGKGEGQVRTVYKRKK